MTFDYHSMWQTVEVVYVYLDHSRFLYLSCVIWITYLSRINVTSFVSAGAALF